MRRWLVAIGLCLTACGSPEVVVEVQTVVATKIITPTATIDPCPHDEATQYGIALYEKVQSMTDAFQLLADKSSSVRTKAYHDIVGLKQDIEALKPPKCAGELQAAAVLYANDLADTGEAVTLHSPDMVAKANKAVADADDVVKAFRSFIAVNKIVLPTDMPSPTFTLTRTPRATSTPKPTLTNTRVPQPTNTRVAVTQTPLPTQPLPVSTSTSSSGGGSYDHNGDGKVTCADFSTQAEAQAAYEAGYKNLDGNDNDGRACESLP